MADFLDIDGFTAEYNGTLTEGETATATRLLGVVSNYIQGLFTAANPPPAVIDPDAAEQVVFEVVRDSVRYGDFDALSKFINTTDHKTEAGTFDPDVKLIESYLTDKQKRLLGIWLVAAPVFNFQQFDYGPPAPFGYGCYPTTFGF